MLAGSGQQANGACSKYLVVYLSERNHGRGTAASVAIGYRLQKQTNNTDLEGGTAASVTMVYKPQKQTQY